MDTMENVKKGIYKNKVELNSTQESRDAYRNESNRIFDQFKNDLFEEFEVTNNPKAEQCFNLAWDYGHANGYAEIYNYFNDLVELIK